MRLYGVKTLYVEDPSTHLPLLLSAPDVIKPLITGLARMGRKDGASLDLVTQETEEIDQIERAVINQCPWQTFLFRQADWDLIAERTNMPPAALALDGDALHGRAHGRPIDHLVTGEYVPLCVVRDAAHPGLRRAAGNRQGDEGATGNMGRFFRLYSDAGAVLSQPTRRVS